MRELRRGVALLGSLDWTLRMGRPELEAVADDRLRGLLGRAAETTFNADRLRRAGIDPAAAIEDDPRAVLRALEPVSKADLREAGTGALHGGRVRRLWRSSRSSGSTGEPFRTYFDPLAWFVLKHVVKLRARWACGVPPGDRMAALDAFPVEEEGDTPMERTGRFRRISVLQSAQEIARKLLTFDPAAVYGLPSALAEAGARLDRPPRRLRRVFTSGELLTGGTRGRLARQYGTAPLDIYGTTETKEIAWECPRGGLHINADMVRVEALNDDGRPAPPGTEGDLVATVLVNTAMPLLRYRLGDRGTLSPDPCACGLALPCMGVVTGRNADSIRIGGRRVSPYAVTTALENVGEIVQYQVRQIANTRLRVRARISGGSDHAVADERIRTALRSSLPGEPSVEVEFTDRFTKGPGGKFRVVEPMSDPDARAPAGPGTPP